MQVVPGLYSLGDNSGGQVRAFLADDGQANRNRESVGKLSDVTQADILCVGHGRTVTQGASQLMRDLVAGRKANPELLGTASSG